MSVGSKIVLLVSIVFIVSLIWFYGGSPEHPAGSIASVQADPEPAAGVADAVEKNQGQVAAAADAEVTVNQPQAQVSSKPTPSPIASLPNPPASQEIVMGDSMPLPSRTANTPAPSARATEAPASGLARRPDSKRPVTKPSTPKSTPKRVETTAKAPAPVTRHVIASGETLSDISLKHYGTATRWELIAFANPEVDPARLRIGSELKIPPRPARKQASTKTLATPRPGTVHHTVSEGDSLSSISLRYYGKEHKWDRIFNANTKQLDGNPDRLRIGMVLVVPTGG